MALKSRKTLILAKVEVTEGTDVTPDGTNDAILVSNVSLTPLAGDTVSRDNMRSYLGNSQQIHVGSHVQVSFDVEVAGSGTAATPPPWGPLLEGCGMEETITTSVAYTPISTGEDSMTMYIHKDGQKHAMVGARGTFSINLSKAGIPKISFTFTGLWVDPASASDPTPVFTAFQSPIPVSLVNTPTVTLGGYDAILENVSMDMAIQVVHSDRPNEEKVSITDRQPSGNISFIAPALSDKNYFTIAKANTEQVMQIIHGTAAGNIVTFDTPKAQVLQPTYGDINGEVSLQAGLALNPDSGDDELTITTS